MKGCRAYKTHGPTPGEGRGVEITDTSVGLDTEIAGLPRDALALWQWRDVTAFWPAG